MSGQHPSCGAPGLAPAPRLQACPGIGGAPSKRPARAEWLTTEVATLRALYPRGGAKAVHAALQHKTLAAIRGKAAALRVKCLVGSTAGRFMPRRWDNRDDIDTMIREGYINAKAKGDCKALAERIGRPAWWVQKRASTLGLTRTNRTRLDAWTQPELDLLDAWSMCANKLIARKLREAGYARTETAVAVKLKRLKLDRENPDLWSATGLAPMFGVDPVTIASWIQKRGLPARREGSGPTAPLLIERARLRKWIERNPERIDLRRVDQTWFKELMWGASA